MLNSAIPPNDGAIDGTVLARTATALAGSDPMRRRNQSIGEAAPNEFGCRRELRASGEESQMSGNPIGVRVDAKALHSDLRELPTVMQQHSREKATTVRLRC